MKNHIEDLKILKQYFQKIQKSTRVSNIFLVLDGYLNCNGKEVNEGIRIYLYTLDLVYKVIAKSS